MNRFTDKDELTRAAALLLPPGHVTELRAMDAMVSGINGRYPVKTISGYFDDPAKLVEAAGKIESATGCYFVLNPVDSRLLARAANRLVKADRGGTTNDTHIVRRIRLLIDIDAESSGGYLGQRRRTRSGKSQGPGNLRVVAIARLAGPGGRGLRQRLSFAVRNRLATGRQRACRELLTCPGPAVQ